MKIEIPIKPLSVNNVWQGKRFKTQAYKKYEKDCSLFCKGGSVKGEIEIHFKFYIKNYAKSDLDNFLKPIIDILVKNGIIEDDRKIRKITAEKIKGDNKIEIFIYPR